VSSDMADGELDPLSVFRLDGRTALVTGASSGLGHRFARVLHAVGANVVVAARRLERLEELAAAHERMLPVRVDLADAEAREGLVAAAEARFGHVDVLVNNAGITDPTPIEDETLDYFRLVMEVNTTAAWHLCKLVGPGMIAAGGGNVVNVASMLGHVGGTPVKQAHYAASKGAVVNLTRELALQWARKWVRVNALCPGWFVSEMTEGMDADEGSQRYVKANTPIPRMGQPEELDGALLLLATGACSFMTGQSVIVDGGWTAR